MQTIIVNIVKYLLNLIRYEKSFVIYHVGIIDNQCLCTI